MPKAQPTNAEIVQSLSRLESVVNQILGVVVSHSDQLANLKADTSHNRKRIDYIYNVLDSHMMGIEDVKQENIMRDRQQERMTGWIKQLAKKTQTKLEPTP